MKDDSENKTDKPLPTAPDFLNKLWKSQAPPAKDNSPTGGGAEVEATAGADLGSGADGGAGDSGGATAGAESPPESDAKNSAQSRRKIAIERYEALKAKQKQNLLLPKTNSPDADGASSSEDGKDSVDAVSTSGAQAASTAVPEGEVLSRHSFSQIEHVTPRLAEPPLLETNAQIKQHPLLSLLVVALLAGVISYLSLFQTKPLPDANHNLGQKEDPHALSERAKAALTDGLYQRSIADFESIARLEGTLPVDLVYPLALAYMGAGQNVSAVQELNKYLASHPDDAKALLELASCRERMNQFRQAMADLNQVLKLEPKCYQAFVQKGRCQTQLSSNAAALKTFNQAVAIAPDRPEAYIFRAAFFARRKQLPQAKKDIFLALKLKGASPFAQYELAKILALEGKSEKALNEFSALSRQPGFKADGRFLIERADVYFQLKNYKSAIADLEEATSKNPEFASISWLKLSDCFAALQDYSKAAKYTAMVLSKEPDNISALVKHGLYSRLSGNSITALAQFFRAIELDPENAAAYAERGDYYTSLKQLNAAVDDYQKAFELDPEFPLVGKKYKAGSLLIKQARFKKSAVTARLNYNVSPAVERELNSSSNQVLKEKGYKALQSNRSSYAIAAFVRALKLNPNDTDTRLYLANALLKAGDTARAESEFYVWLSQSKSDSPSGASRASVSSALTFAREMALRDEADRVHNILEHIAAHYRDNGPALLQLSKVSRVLGFEPIATSALERGCQLATRDQLVDFFGNGTEPKKTSVGKK